MSWKAIAAAGGMLMLSFQAVRVYLEQEAEIKTKRMEVDILKEESRVKGQELAILEAWVAEQARGQALKAEKARLGAFKAEEARGWFPWSKL
ncbi:unnamed protein product [Urochloa humidicola]